MRFLPKPRVSVELLTAIWVQVVSVVAAGSGLMVATLATHGVVAFLVVLVASIVTAIAALLLVRIKEETNRPWKTQLAILPAVIAAVALVAYCSVLITVHNRAVDAQITSAHAALTRRLPAANAANRAVDIASKAAATAVGDLTRELRRLPRLGPAATQRFVDRVEHARGLLSELRRQQDFQAFRSFSAALPLRPKVRRELVQKLDIAIRDQQKYAAAERVYAATPRVKLPVFNALPPWFSRLGSFFQLAVQLLTALALALIFARPRFSEDAERYLRVALPFSYLGITAAFVGSLPDLHRGLQALLFGYVVAGFAGILAGTVLASSGTLPAKHPDVEQTEGQA